MILDRKMVARYDLKHEKLSSNKIMGKKLNGRKTNVTLFRMIKLHNIIK